MLKRFFGNCWLRHVSTICFASGFAFSTLTPAFGHGHSDGHSGVHTGSSMHHTHASHHSSYGHHTGGYGIGGIGIGFSGYSGFGGYSGRGYGYPYGYSSSRLGYSNLGYSGMGYSNYSAYSAARPSNCYSPAIVQRSNVYTGPMSANGQPTGDLRPGMVLPDDAVVISVGSASK